jgi:zinc protease
VNPSLTQNGSKIALALALLGTGCKSSTAQAPAKPSESAAQAAPAPAPATTPDAPFRAKQPVATGELAFRAPAVKTLALKNGLPVYLVERHDVPLVTVALVVQGGRAAEPEGKVGAAVLLTALLDEGTAKLTAPQVAQAFESLAIEHDASARGESILLDMGTLTASLDPALDIFSECVLHPALRDADVERVRNERLAALVASHDDPDQVADDVLRRAIFGAKSPLAHPARGTAAGLKATKRADLLALHAQLFSPDRAALLVVGDVTPEALLPKLEARFGAAAWKAQPRRQAVARPAPVGPAPHEVWLVDKPGAPQSQIWAGRQGLAMVDPDYFAFEVANSILGGLFASRLNLNLREGKGWSYGVASYAALGRTSTRWLAGGGFMSDKTSESLAELNKELERMHGGDVTPEELQAAQESLVRSLTGQFATNTGVAQRLAVLLEVGAPLDFYATWGDKLRAVTAADVKRVAQKVVDPTQMTYVVVGPRAEQGAKLEALKLAPVVNKDEAGEPSK